MVVGSVWLTWSTPMSERCNAVVFLQVMASQKQLEAKYKQAQATAVSKRSSMHSSSPGAWGFSAV